MAFLLSTTSLLTRGFSPVEGSGRTWCSPLTCRISWRDSEQSPCWGFWPWRALYRSGWDYRAFRMDKCPHCSSVAVLQHNGGLTDIDRVTFSADLLAITLPEKRTRHYTESRGRNNLCPQQRKKCEGWGVCPIRIRRFFLTTWGL